MTRTNKGITMRHALAVGLFLAGAWIAACYMADRATRAQAKCEQTFSTDTCVYALR